MPAKKSFVCLFLVLLILTNLFVKFSKEVRAISSCEANVDTSSLGTGVSGTLSFSVKNTDDQVGNAIWVKISIPSSDFTITGGSASGWTTTATSGEIIFQGGNLNADQTSSFSVNVQTGATPGTGGSFEIVISDSDGGGNPQTCTGNTSVSVISLSISAVTVSEIGNSSAKISWTTTDASNSTVNYGTTSSYGSTKSDATLTTSHVLDISSLSANTTYHYKIVSTDANSNTVQTGDNTFVTAKSSTTVTNTVTTTVTTIKTELITDTVVPESKLSLDSKKVYSEAPDISGSATDNGGISKVEFSVDNGVNWLPVDINDQIGSKLISFSFTPLGLMDGNYNVRVRITDTSGNKNTSKAYKLVIDRLPPMVGTSTFSFGSVNNEPNQDGTIVTIPGIDQKITLSAVGGPTKIDIVSGQSVFSLVENSETGLWSGFLSFSKEGIYDLLAKSIDGAGNITERKLNSVLVVSSGKVTAMGIPAKDAVVSLYVKRGDTNEFILWESKVYGQKNPQIVGWDGGYSFFPPGGTYYIEVSSPNHNTYKSAIFSSPSYAPILHNISLTEKNFIKLGPVKIEIPDFKKYVTREGEIYDPEIKNIEEKESLQKSLTGVELGFYEVMGESGKVSTYSFRGKDAIVSFLSSWSPDISSQLSELQKIGSNTQVQIVPVFVSETLTMARIQKSKSGYEIPVYADKDGKLVIPFDLQYLPFHIAFDRKGIVKNVKVGILKEEDVDKFVSID